VYETAAHGLLRKGEHGDQRGTLGTATIPRRGTRGDLFMKRTAKGTIGLVLAGSLVAACSGLRANGTTSSDGHGGGQDGTTGSAASSSATNSGAGSSTSAEGGGSSIGSTGGGDAAGEGGGADRLLGTWTYSGKVPAQVTLAITFNSDKTCIIVEQVAPATTPAGHTNDSARGCTTTDTYLGTYTETDPAGTNTLTMTFTDGTANAILGCEDASDVGAGVPMTADGITSYRSQGLIPAMTVTYAVTSTTLSFSPGFGLGMPATTTFTKLP
jgi:hypothetical protein